MNEWKVWQGFEYLSSEQTKSRSAIPTNESKTEIKCKNKNKSEKRAKQRKKNLFFLIATLFKSHWQKMILCLTRPLLEGSGIGSGRLICLNLPIFSKRNLNLKSVKFLSRTCMWTWLSDLRMIIILTRSREGILERCRISTPFPRNIFK